MASTREIKNRIKSIQDTQKITNAMYMISSTKMRKVKKELDATRPYFDTLVTSIARMVQHLPEAESKFFAKEEGLENAPSRRGYLVITADKGLAGAYNHNILKLVQRELGRGGSCKLFVMGEVGRQYFRQRHVPIEEDFSYSAQNPNLNRARTIGYDLLERYELKELDEIYVVYTDMENSITNEAKILRLLPLEKGYFELNESDADMFSGDYEFFPSVQRVLDRLIPSWIVGFIYSALVDSFCAEQSARMTAMDAANRNAEQMLHDLTIQFNRVRQGIITQEITEIAAGARAQKQKKSS